MPTPPAININCSIASGETSGGGHTKLPPTLTLRLEPLISFSGLHNQAAGALLDFWMASSKYPRLDGDAECSASLGVDVIVNPPT